MPVEAGAHLQTWPQACRSRDCAVCPCAGPFAIRRSWLTKNKPNSISRHDGCPMRRPVGADARRRFRALLGPAGSHRRTARCIQPRSVQPGPLLAWGSACVGDRGECASACPFPVAWDKEVVPLVARRRASFGSVWLMQRCVSLHFPSGPTAPSALGGMPSQAATPAGLHACRHPALSLLRTQAGLALGRSPP